MKLLERARNIRNQTEQAAQYLPDDVAVNSPDIYPKWGTSSDYVVGGRVVYQGVLYRCLLDHAGQAGWNPIDAPSLWTKVLISDDGTILPWEQPDSTNPYQIGDKVIHNEKIWESIVADNVWEPGVYGWIEVEDEESESGSDETDSSDANGESESAGENADSDSGSNESEDVPTEDDPEEDTVVIPEWEQRYGHNPYMTGDRVMYNGNVYESTLDGNTYSPDTYPAGWKLVS